MKQILSFWMSLLLLIGTSMGIIASFLIAPTFMYWSFGGLRELPVGGLPGGIGVSWPFHGVLVNCLTGIPPSLQSCLQVPNVGNFILGVIIDLSTVVVLYLFVFGFPKRDR